MLKKIAFAALLSLPFAVNAQDIEKIKKLSFCGFLPKDTSWMWKQYNQQLRFLNINDNDTIVDIGAQSGTYEGALSTLGNFKNVSFFLVDIDTNCLNPYKLYNMVQYFESLKGEKFSHSFQIINNTPDSLWLPLRTFKKVWIMNTLHEVPDKNKMIQDIAAVIAPGGELIIVELMATEKRPRHGGCKNFLLTKPEIEKLCVRNGFVFKEEIINPVAVTKMPNPMYMFRYIKSN